VRAVNDLIRCPVCKTVVDHDRLFNHLINGGHLFKTIRAGYRAASPRQRLEAVLGGVLVGLVVLTILLVLR
jgi:uncharacterized C2H2 Zn-finger protein